MEDKLKGIHHDLVWLMAEAINTHHPNHQLPDLIARAADLVRDAQLIAANPKLQRVQTLSFGGNVHAAHGLTTVCGKAPNPFDTLLPGVRVPTCEKCIQIIMLDPVLWKLKP